MALESKERLIGEHTYRVTQLGAKAGRAMLVRLMKLLGASASNFLDAIGHATDAESAIAGGLGDAIRELATRITAEETGALLDELAASTVVVLADREPKLDKIFDLHFAGRYGEMMGWAAFALEVNFASFFVGPGGIAAKISQAMAAIGFASRSPQVSTGTSTASQPAASTHRA